MSGRTDDLGAIVSDVTIVNSGPDPLFGVTGIEQHGPRMVAAMRSDPRFTGPDGRPAVGGLGVLVDNVLGYAIMATMPRCHDAAG